MGKKEDYLKNELKAWFSEKLIDESTFNLLNDRYPANAGWNLQSLIKWFLLIGAISLGVGVVGIATAVLISLGFLSFILLASGVASLLLGIWLAQPKSKWFLPKTGNAVVVIGCLLLGGSVFTFAKYISPSGDHWAVLFLIIALLYIVISYTTKNSAVLVMALLALATWFGAETGYVSGWGAYFLGMNYPIRFALVSPFIVALGYLHLRFLPKEYSGFARVLYSMGLLYSGLALWILSIWGPGDSILIGASNSHLILAGLSLLWLAVSVGILLIGLKFDDVMFRGYGVTFLVLNLYTRYYEYFWNEMDKWVFFIVIGVLTLSVGILVERKIKNRKV